MKVEEVMVRDVISVNRNSSIEEIEATEEDNDKFKNKIKTIESKESKIHFY